MQGESPKALWIVFVLVARLPRAALAAATVAVVVVAAIAAELAQRPAFLDQTSPVREGQQPVRPSPWPIHSPLAIRR
jgi:hypothetical protein